MKKVKIAAAAMMLALAFPFAQPACALEPPEEPVSRKGFSLPPPDLNMEGNQSFSPGLVARFRARLAGNRSANLLSSEGLPSEGRPQVLVLLVDFDEFPARPVDTPEDMRERLFGSGGEFPYESLSAYYRRSSFGKLNIEGDVLGWYRAGRRADVPETREGRDAVIKAALLNYKEHDFSKYDNNGDGVIDYFMVIWTGPNGKWATFWWGKAARFSDPAFRIGGLGLGMFSWQGVVRKWGSAGEKPNVRVLVHETGHALGLPDYYDYKSGVGPDGGLGMFDMMDSDHYDHNCFSKLMLGWVEPKVIAQDGEYSLNEAAETGDCAMLVPRGRPADPFSEFFLLENRRKSGNDADVNFEGGGLTVWHVDARLNEAGTNFLYNNQIAEHKLLRLMEADGKEDIETGRLIMYDAQDFYTEGRVLGPQTLPSSRLYDGTDTGITLLSKGGGYDAGFELRYQLPAIVPMRPPTKGAAESGRK